MSDSDFLSRSSSYEADYESSCSSYTDSESEPEQEDIYYNNNVLEFKQTKKLEKKKSSVLLEGSTDDLKRTKSLTDDDLEELKGCVDLGFGFNYEEIPELCNTLPALELCYSMSQKFMDHDHHSEKIESQSSPVSPIASWKISSPGDNPDDVKARLKFWAQAVACTVRLCS